MSNIDKLIKIIQDLNEVGAIGFSTYKELIVLAREIQVEAIS